MRISAWVHATFVCALLLSCKTRSTNDTKVKEAWNAKNNPSLFDVKTAKFSDLPLSGEMPADRFPWSDGYWAHFQNGIAFRWQYGNLESNLPKDYRYPLLTKEQLLDPSADLSKLSPAEKYDIMQGRYDFPLTKSEWKKADLDTNPKTGEVPLWYGICHGWAPASINEPEPGPEVIATNPDGLKVPFYPSDLNALMSLIYAGIQKSEHIGVRCDVQRSDLILDENGRVTFDNCRDTNPGALHLVLAQYLGNPDPTQRKSFVVDKDQAAAIWNQPVTAYKVSSHQIVPFDPTTDAAAKHRAPNTASLVKVETELQYLHEGDPHKGPSPKPRIRKMFLKYTLELDAQGMIIGGEWTGDEVPDFIWQIKDRPDTKGQYLDYEIVRDLVDKSRMN
jgi:hypothetical protein